MDQMERGMEVGDAVQDQVQLILGSNDILQVALQEVDRRTFSLEAEVKEQREAVEESKRREEQTEQRVTECRNRVEHLEGSLQRLEEGIKEGLEQGKTVIGQLQQLQQGLIATLHQVVYQELRRFVDEKRAQAAPSLSVPTPINYIPGSTVGVLGAAGLQASPASWEGVTGPSTGGAHLGQTPERYQGNTVVNQFSPVISSADILRGVQLGQLSEEVVTLPVTLGATGAGGEFKQSPGGLLGSPAQQLGLHLKTGGAEIQPGTSGSLFSAEFAVPELKEQEGPAREQGRRTDQARDTRRRSGSPSRGKTKRARETSREGKERFRGTSGHTGKSSRELQQSKRENLLRRSGSSREGEEDCEGGEKIQQTGDWVRSHRRPKASSLESVVVTYENTGRSRREAPPSHGRFGVRSRSRSRSRDRHRAGEPFQKRESRRK